MKNNHSKSLSVLTLICLVLSSGLQAEAKNQKSKVIAVFTAKAVHYGNKETDDFIAWLKKTKREHQIISLELDENKAIIGMSWNICTYADVIIIEKLAKLSDLKSFEVYTIKASLSDEAYQKFKSNHKKHKCDIEKLTDDFKKIKIEQVVAPDGE